ncbi:TlyA family RNA methyltransferase [Pseudoclavibacter soli]|uniref:TlyA family RNA methyltransferase n=1 Tax=Pseudoclavibacter soli TaxID=452623 RepID=UPI000403AE09|nr:TlyA family RNA methyltransferase [Pseudoclavibacter soli]
MRLDQALVERGLARSRPQARALLDAGAVAVPGLARLKPATAITDEQTITVAGDHHYVGRAAFKLIGALDDFGIDVTGRVALDAGASTGGFTQVLRERGCAHVYAVDVGHDQLAASVAADPQVTNIEGLNLRTLKRDQLRPAHAEHPPEHIDLLVGDLSFISLTQVLEPLTTELHPTDAVLLVKPQFEVGRGNLGRGGVVSDAALQRAAVERVAVAAEQLGWAVAGVVASRIAGESGNQEYPIWLSTDRAQEIPWRQLLPQLTERRSQ